MIRFSPLPDVMGPRSPLTKTSWATRRDDRYSGYISLKTLRFPGRWKNSLADINSAFPQGGNLKVGDLIYFGLPCRSDRAYCSLSIKKMHAIMSLYVADMLATFQTPIFFPVDTEICGFHWKNGWSFAHENAFIGRKRNQCRICLLFSELTICFPLKEEWFLRISTVQISEASTVLTLEIIWSCRLCELQKLFTIDGNNSWSPSFQALNLIRWLVLLFYSPGSPKTSTKIGVHQRLFFLVWIFVYHPKMGTIIFQIFDFQRFNQHWGPQRERWSQWSPSCNDPPRHLEEAWSSNIDKEHRGFNDFLGGPFWILVVHNVFILFDELRSCREF